LNKNEFIEPFLIIIIFYHFSYYLVIFLYNTIATTDNTDTPYNTTLLVPAFGKEVSGLVVLDVVLSGCVVDDIGVVVPVPVLEVLLVAVGVIVPEAVGFEVDPVPTPDVEPVGVNDNPPVVANTCIPIKIIKAIVSATIFFFIFCFSFIYLS